MMSVFADAAFYIALGNPRDENHAVATQLAGAFSGRVVTTEYVPTEVANYLSRPPLRTKFLVLLQSLRADRQTEILASSS